MAALLERDALLSEIDEEIDFYDDSKHQDDKFITLGMKIARKLVKKHPAVNRWIPCSERMPTMNEMRQSDCVLVCALDENWIGMAYYIGDGWAFADAQTKPRLETVEITHWMPLPEPPESEEVQEDEQCG